MGHPAGQLAKRGDRALITDGLLIPSEEISQPCYQVRVKSQINILVNEKSLIYKVKCFSEIGESKRGVAFVQVAVYELKKVN